MTDYVYKGLTDMIAAWEKQYGKKPLVMALGKTHLKDLEDYVKVTKRGLTFEDIEVILNNDPIGVIFAHRTEIRSNNPSPSEEK